LKTIDGTTVGAIGIARPSKEMEGAADTVRATIILVGAIASVLAGGAGFLFGRGLGARLDDLREAAGRWTLGELSTPARDREPFLARWITAEFLRDEINQLAEQLDQMREGFRQAIERMRKR
jgi:methyl-accepting chemotaxis protein